MRITRCEPIRPAMRNPCYLEPEQMTLQENGSTVVIVPPDGNMRGGTLEAIQK